MEDFSSHWKKTIWYFVIEGREIDFFTDADAYIVDEETNQRIEMHVQIFYK